MLTLRVAPRAQRQIDKLLRYSEATFGTDASERYRLLVIATLNALTKDPEPAARLKAPVIRPTWLYHMMRTRALVTPLRRVASPRHFVVYRITKTHLEVVQVLDDRMDLPAHLR